jgi:hypothetical protein
LWIARQEGRRGLGLRFPASAAALQRWLCRARLARRGLAGLSACAGTVADPIERGGEALGERLHLAHCPGGDPTEDQAELAPAAGVALAAVSHLEGGGALAGPAGERGYQLVAAVGIEVRCPFPAREQDIEAFLALS